MPRFIEKSLGFIPKIAGAVFDISCQYILQNAIRVEKTWANLKRWLGDNVLRCESLEAAIYECLER
jgi:hypothetical protein